MILVFLTSSLTTSRGLISKNQLKEEEKDNINWLRCWISSLFCLYLLLRHCWLTSYYFFFNKVNLLLIIFYIITFLYSMFLVRTKYPENLQQLAIGQLNSKVALQYIYSLKWVPWISIGRIFLLCTKDRSSTKGNKISYRSTSWQSHYILPWKFPEQCQSPNTLF